MQIPVLGAGALAEATRLLTSPVRAASGVVAAAADLLPRLEHTLERCAGLLDGPEQRRPQVVTALDALARSAPLAPGVMTSLEELTTQTRAVAAGPRGAKLAALADRLDAEAVARGAATAGSLLDRLDAERTPSRVAPRSPATWSSDWTHGSRTHAPRTWSASRTGCRRRSRLRASTLSAPSSTGWLRYSTVRARQPPRTWQRA